MFLNRSAGRRFVITSIAVVTFAALYEVTFLDSRFAARQSDEQELTAAPAPGIRLRFTATGYCRGTTTASGVNVRSGIAAADPDLLPVGSVVRIENLPAAYNGIYTVMDTGPKVHGRHLDIYIWNCDEALELGRRQMVITVLRMGWNPRHSTPRLVDQLFRQREAVLPPPPAWPAPGDATSQDVADPDATKPDATKPNAIKPDATKPDVTRPDVTRVDLARQRSLDDR